MTCIECGEESAVWTCAGCGKNVCNDHMGWRIIGGLNLPVHTKSAGHAAHPTPEIIAQEQEHLADWQGSQEAK